MPNLLSIPDADLLDLRGDWAAPPTPATPSVSSILSGERDVIAARRRRKLLGGAVRQAGLLAPAIVALTDVLPHLVEAPARARLLVKGLVELPGVSVDIQTVQTNLGSAVLRSGPDGHAVGGAFGSAPACARACSDRRSSASSSTTRSTTGAPSGLWTRCASR